MTKYPTQVSVLRGNRLRAIDDRADPRQQELGVGRARRIGIGRRSIRRPLWLAPRIGHAVE